MLHFVLQSERLYVLIWLGRKREYPLCWSVCTVCWISHSICLPFFHVRTAGVPVTETAFFKRVFTELRKATINFVVSVCLSLSLSVSPHATNRLPLDGFSWNKVFEFLFSKICREYSCFIKIWQAWRVFYMKVHVNLC
jgi:hypothetical protein